MGPSFTVGALALAGRRANAVGAVRVTLTLEALELELVRVAGFSLGFAPGAVAEPVSFRVPFTAVRGLVREGRALYLTFDPAVVTPHNRFALAGFSEDPVEVLARAYQARARARWAAALLPAPLGALAAALVPEELAGGLLGRASLGVLSALILFAALRGFWAYAAWGGPRSERLRDRFEAELSERLALVPGPAARPRGPAPALALRLPAHPRARPPALPAPLLTPARAAEGAPPERSHGLARPLLAAAGAAVGIVGVMAFLQRYAAPRPPPPAVDRLLGGLGAVARAARPPVEEPLEPERCVCTRADSPLWNDGVPVLGILTFHGDAEAAGELSPTLDRRGFPGFDFDLAVVNDGDRALHDVRLTLTFARRSASGRRVGAVDRGRFWEGALLPGAAVKWRVKAPGSEMRVDASVTGTLEQAHLDPAPADAFFRLTSSRFRAVRVHGALMLAYLRDPRAEAAVRALEAQSAADEPLLARIQRAAAPVFACEVRRAEDRLTACVFNGSSKARTALMLREVTPAGQEGRSFYVRVGVPVHEGRRASIAVPDDLAGEIAVGDPTSP